MTPKTQSISSDPFFRTEPAPAASQVDLQTGSVDSPRGPSWLKRGDLPLSLLRLLFRDACVGGDGVPYAALLEALYSVRPEQVSHSGVRRLHTLLGRVRFWARSCDLSLSLEVERGRVRLCWDDDLLRFLPEREGQWENLDSQVVAAERILRNVFPEGRWVGSAEVARVLNVSIRTTNYRLKALCESGKVVADGRGPARRYRFRPS